MAHKHTKIEMLNRRCITSICKECEEFEECYKDANKYIDISIEVRNCYKTKFRK